MRLGILVSIAVGLLILGIVVLRGAIAPDGVRARLEAALAEAIGAPIRLSGASDVRLTPLPRIEWRDAVLTDATTGAPLLSAATIETSLALTPLLRGVAEPTSITLDGARIALDQTRLRTVLSHASALPAFDLRLRRSTLDLTLAVGRVERFEAVEGKIVRSAAALSADLTGRWRDETVGLEVSAPLGPAATRWRVVAEAAGAALKAGGLRATDRVGLDGTVALTVPDPARLAKLLALGPRGDLLRAPATLEADLTATPTSLTLADLRLTLAGSTATGSLALSIADTEPALSGTLAFADLDLTKSAPIFGDGWRDLALDDHRPVPALDLRLSAKRLIAPRFELMRPAASLNLADGRLNAEIGDAGLWDRPVSAVLVGDFGKGGLAARLRALAKDLPAIEVGRLFAIDGVEAGAISAAFEGETRCATLGACAAAIEGRLRLSATGLAVTGASPFGDVTRFHPIVVAPKAATRKAVWPEAEADIRLAGTAATVDVVEIRGADARFALKGTGDLSNGAVDLTGHAFFRNLRAAPAAEPTDRVIRIPLQIHGTIRKLTITPAMPEQVPIEAPVTPLTPIPIVPPIAVPAR